MKQTKHTATNAGGILKLRKRERKSSEKSLRLLRMKNEFGVLLDKNGYAPSIISHENVCLNCYTTLNLQRHEVFHGTAFRQKSKAYGLWVLLCPVCHLTKVHNSDGELDLKLKELGQQTAMTCYGWSKEEFRERFGRNYV